MSTTSKSIRKSCCALAAETHQPVRPAATPPCTHDVGRPGARVAGRRGRVRVRRSGRHRPGGARATPGGVRVHASTGLERAAGEGVHPDRGPLGHPSPLGHRAPHRDQRRPTDRPPSRRAGCTCPAPGAARPPARHLIKCPWPWGTSVASLTVAASSTTTFNWARQSVATCTSAGPRPRRHRPGAASSAAASAARRLRTGTGTSCRSGCPRTCPR